MKILVSGVSGLIGSDLVPFLKQNGHIVFKLTRSHPVHKDEIYWNPDEGILDPAQVEGVNAIINLAGERVAGRWTSKKKEDILERRLRSTTTSVKTIGMMKVPPEILINASAVGFYGNQEDRILTEQSPPGKGFLSMVCEQWEEAALEASQRGVRVALMRFGMVLSAKGGALGMMINTFRLGIGGIIGSGDQYMSWIAIQDLLAAVDFVLSSNDMKGPINTVSPNPVTNETFTKTLGIVLKRPTIFPVPAFAARLLFGEMADEMLLSSTQAIPEKLLKAGFTFKYPQLEEALKAIIS